MKDVNILIIDDAREVRELLKVKLNELGLLNVEEAEDGESGIALYRENRPSMVFIDINLPDFNGFDALAQIKAIDPQAFVVMISGNSDIKSVQESIKLGAAGFIVKPLSPSKIEQTVNKYLQSGSNS